jgi:hypothetical protein
MNAHAGQCLKSQTNQNIIGLIGFQPGARAPLVELAKIGKGAVLSARSV